MVSPRFLVERSAKIRLAMASVGKKDTNVGTLCKELGITRQTLYRDVSPTGQFREAGQTVLAQHRGTTRAANFEY